MLMLGIDQNSEEFIAHKEYYESVIKNKKI
jgi:hypothetical protein